MPPTAADHRVSEAGGDAPPAPARSVWERGWRAPLWAHALVLAAVLVAAMLWAGTETSFSMDEPAVILQAQQLADGGGWITPNPLPSIDPDETWFYVVRSDQGANGTALYARHAAYPFALAFVARLGGQRAMVLVSVAGTVAAALVAAAIARRLDDRDDRDDRDDPADPADRDGSAGDPADRDDGDHRDDPAGGDGRGDEDRDDLAGAGRTGRGAGPALDRWAFWATGLGSPLLFDSQLVIAHAAAAPLASGALLLLVGLRSRFGWGRVLAAAALVGATCLLRTEGMLLAVALAGGAVVHARTARDRRWVLVGVALLGAGVVTAVFDRLYVTRLVGTGVTNYTVDDGTGSFLQTRLPALFGMVLAPGDEWPPATQLALVLALVGALVLGYAIRRNPPPRALVLGAALVLVGGAVAALAQGPAGVIPSLLVACPTIAAGVAATRADAWRTPMVRWLGGMCAGFIAMVAVIQYGQGGGIEWGARFLAIIVPVLVALAVWTLGRALRATEAARSLDRTARRLAVGGLVVGSLALGALGLATVRSFHDSTARFAARLSAAALAAPGPDLGDGDERPIVVSTWFVVGRLTSGKTVPVRGLSVIGQPLAPVLDRLDAAGVDRFVLVVDDLGDLQELDGKYRVVPSPDRPPEGPIFVVERTS